MTLTIDFDNCLSLPEVQHHIKVLIQKGVKVYVLTNRFDEINKHHYPLNPSNEDLWQVCWEVGISPRNVIFLNNPFNFYPKAKYLKHTSVDVHIDDCYKNVRYINQKTNTKAYQIDRVNYKNVFKLINEML